VYLERECAGPVPMTQWISRSSESLTPPLLSVSFVQAVEKQQEVEHLAEAEAVSVPAHVRAKKRQPQGRSPIASPSKRRRRSRQKEVVDLTSPASFPSPPSPPPPSVDSLRARGRARGRVPAPGNRVAVEAGMVVVVAAGAVVALEVDAEAAEGAVGSGFDDPRGSIPDTHQPSVGGRLSHFCANWRQLPLSTFVWDVVTEGHFIPFQGEPRAA
jgi:hypothetical protein